MLKQALTALILPSFFLLSQSHAGTPNSVARSRVDGSRDSSATGTLQKLIVETGIATMELYPARLNGIGSIPGGATQVQFAVAANTFFPILVLNDALRGPLPGSIALIPKNAPALPGR